MKNRLSWLAGFVLLTILSAGLLAFVGASGAQEGRNAAHDLDEELIGLVNSRDMHAIIAALESGRIPNDYLYKGEVDLLTIATNRKLTDLVRFLLETTEHPIDVLKLRGFFLKDDGFSAESIDIARSYITDKYGVNGGIFLDFYDSLFLSLLICDRVPYTEKEINQIFDGLEIFVVDHLYKEVVAALSSGEIPPGDGYYCSRAVTESVGSWSEQ